MTDQPKKKGSDLLALIPKSGTAVAKFGEMRRQRTEALQALARVLADLAATPEYIRLSPAPAPKDEAPF